MMRDVFPSEEELKRRSDGSDETTCHLCGRSFANSSACRMHKVKTHRLVQSASDGGLRRGVAGSGDPPSRFHCPLHDCRKTFSAFRHIRQHYVKCHTVKSLECSGCDRLFALQKDLKYHIKNTCNSDSRDRIRTPRKRSKRVEAGEASTSSTGEQGAVGGEARGAGNTLILPGVLPSSVVVVVAASDVGKVVAQLTGNRQSVCVAVQTDSGATPLAPPSLAPPTMDSAVQYQHVQATQTQHYNMYAPMHDSTSQTMDFYATRQPSASLAPPSLTTPTEDFGSQLGEGLVFDERREDWRDIETQTMSSWADTGSMTEEAYWR